MHKSIENCSKKLLPFTFPAVSVLTNVFVDIFSLKSNTNNPIL